MFFCPSRGRSPLPISTSCPSFFLLLSPHKDLSRTIDLLHTPHPPRQPAILPERLCELDFLPTSRKIPPSFPKASFAYPSGAVERHLEIVKPGSKGRHSPRAYLHPRQLDILHNDLLTYANVRTEVRREKRVSETRIHVFEAVDHAGWCALPMPPGQSHTERRSGRNRWTRSGGTRATSCRVSTIVLARRNTNNQLIPRRVEMIAMMVSLLRMVQPHLCSSRSIQDVSSASVIPKFGTTINSLSDIITVAEIPCSNDIGLQEVLHSTSDHT